LAEKYYYNSPYAFSENKVVAHVEVEGLESEFAVTLLNSLTSKKTEGQMSESDPPKQAQNEETGEDPNLQGGTKQGAQLSVLANDAENYKEESKERGKEMIKDGADGAKDLGGKMRQGGLALSACGQPEVGVPMIAVGSCVEGAGTVVSVAMKASEGDGYGAAMETFTGILDMLVGKVMGGFGKEQGLDKQGQAIFEGQKEIVKEVCNAAGTQMEKRK
jgi:hypothetical protein